MRTVRLLTMLVVLALLASAVSACVPPTAAPAKPAEAVTIRVISQFGIGSPYQELWEKVYAEFAKDYPNIKVEFDWAGGEFTQKWRAELSAGHPHDILWHNEPTTHALAREGVTLNLSNYIEKDKNYEGDKTFKDSFIATLLQRAWVPDAKDGAGYYAVPQAQYIDGIFYNKAIFEELGIQVPKTWSEFLAACEKIKASGKAAIALDGTITGYNAYWFYDLSQRIVGAQTVYDTATNKPGTSFKDTPGFLEAAQKIEELVQKGYFMKGYEGSAWPAAQMEFVQGKAGMILMKAWLPGEMLPNTPEGFQWGFFNFPMVEGGKGDPTGIQIKYNGFVIAKLSPHPDEAMLFIKKLVSRSAQEGQAKNLSPAVILGVPVPDALADAMAALEAAKEVYGYGDGLDRDAAEWQTRVFNPIDDKLVLGQIGAQEFIDQLQKEHEAYWAQKK